VALNARDAADRGAVICTRTKAVSATRGRDDWSLGLEGPDGQRETVKAKIVINAAGPWVADVLTSTLRMNADAKVRMVQGSHIVVKRLFDHDRCYIFQNADNRIIFAIPYERDFTLIGTTDRDYEGDPAKVKATPEEIDYLCRAASEYFARPITSADLVWDYSGVRPLYDDGASAAQAATRDYVLVLDETGGAPLLSIFGGKITTYRRLAEHAIEKLDHLLPAVTKARRGWSGRTPLPGGDFPATDFDGLVDELEHAYPFLDRGHARRLARAYGTRARSILAGATSNAALGQDFGATLTEREVIHLMDHEFARRAEDVLWRRSKLGLRLTKEQAEVLDGFMAERASGAASSALTGSAPR
jgi:glycerol-3-phosphate dehydrogenase